MFELEIDWNGTNENATSLPINQTIFAIRIKNTHTPLLMLKVCTADVMEFMLILVYLDCNFDWVYQRHPHIQTNTAATAKKPIPGDAIRFETVNMCNIVYILFIMKDFTKVNELQYFYRSYYHVSRWRHSFEEHAQNHSEIFFCLVLMLFEFSFFITDSKSYD